MIWEWDQNTRFEDAYDQIFFSSYFFQKNSNETYFDSP